MASVRVILSARAAWAVANDAYVAENVRTESMMARKSRADIEICCDGGAMMLSLVTSVGVVVLGVEGSGGAEDVGAVGNGAVVVGARTEDAGT